MNASFEGVNLAYTIVFEYTTNNLNRDGMPESLKLYHFESEKITRSFFVRKSEKCLINNIFIEICRLIKKE